MNKTLYLDNNASTPIDPRVREAIDSELDHALFNPSSPHASGQAARGRLDKYRRTVSSYFGVKPQEILFTSSGTEALNFLIHSVLDKREGKILSSEAEHSAVYECLSKEKRSHFLKGVVTPEMVAANVDENTALIALMAVNNETGVKTDIDSIAKIAEKFRIPFVVDAVAWLGKEKISIPKGVSGMAVSGHKIHAPPGTGCTILRPPFKSSPLIVGGAQEYGLRGGTENLVSISAFAKAIELIPQDPASHLLNLRNLFERLVKEALPEVIVNGEEFERASNVSNIRFPDADGETLLMRLDQLGVACSLGSACTSGALEPSRVLLTMGLSYPQAKSSIRFSFSRMNTDQEIIEAVSLIRSLF